MGLRADVWLHKRLAVPHYPLRRCRASLVDCVVLADRPGSACECLSDHGKVQRRNIQPQGNPVRRQGAPNLLELVVDAHGLRGLASQRCNSLAAHPRATTGRADAAGLGMAAELEVLRENLASVRRHADDVFYARASILEVDPRFERNHHVLIEDGALRRHQSR